MTETPAIYNASPISEWQTMEMMATQLHKSGFMPDAIKTPMQALAIIQLGKELGLPPMFSIRNIFVIGGKPTLNAQGMAAIIKQKVHPDAITVEASTNDKCTVSYWRPTWKARRELVFTMADAERAGLIAGPNGHTWKKYPRNMLQARAISGVAIMEFQDVLGGIYTPEELGASVDYDQQGNIQVSVIEEPKLDATPPAKSLEAYVDAGIGPASIPPPAKAPAAMPPPDADNFVPYTEMPAGAGGRAITMQDVLGRVRDYEGQCKSMAINFPAAPADDAPILDWANYAKRLAWLIKQAGGL